MKRTLLMLALAATVAAATYEVDPVHSSVIFKIQHLGTSWTYGRFNDISGSIEMDAAKPEASSVTFTVKVDSVDTGNAKRDQHLKSPDFFNAKQFPEITFKSTAVKSLGKDAAEVTGDLSLHGVTKSVTAKVSKVGEGKHPKSGAEMVGFEASFLIKRTDFGMTYAVGPTGGGDEVSLIVALETHRK